MIMMAVLGWGQSWTDVTTGITTNFNAICKTPDSTVYAVGDDGVILKKLHNGTWQQIFSGTTDDLRSVNFPSNDVGYTIISVLGGGMSSSAGVLNYTFNGADTFNNSFITAEYLNDIFFVNDSTGWVVGKNGLIMKTNNRGASWTAQTPFNNLFEFRSIFFINDSIGWACGNEGVIRKTTNGGQNWINQSLQGSISNGLELNAVFFISQTHGWMADDRNIHYTTDGGNSWIAVTVSATVNDVFFNSNLEGWAVGLGGTRFYTNDGGLNWTLHSTGGPQLNSVTFISPNKGWAVGYNGKILEYSTNTSIDFIESEFKFSIIPNPANTVANINFSEYGNYFVRITDLNGKFIKILNVEHSKNIEINTSDFTSGIYNVIVNDYNGNVTSKRLIIK
jgi:photosystem II stability/assembly factor-like uncharacterized protein